MKSETAFLINLPLPSRVELSLSAIQVFCNAHSSDTIHLFKSSVHRATWHLKLRLHNHDFHSRMLINRSIVFLNKYKRQGECNAVPETACDFWQSKINTSRRYPRGFYSEYISASIFFSRCYKLILQNYVSLCICLYFQVYTNRK